MSAEVIEIITEEILVVEVEGEQVELLVEQADLEVVEVAEQGPPGRDAGETEADDYVLLLNIAML